MRPRKRTWVLLLIVGVVMLLFLLWGGNRSDHEVEKRLEERYGKPFLVLTSDRIPDKQKAEKIQAATVYIAAPEENPHERFFVYSTVKRKSAGEPEYVTEMVDTYKLHTMKKLFEEAGREAGMEVSFTYQREPFWSVESYYYSGLEVHIAAAPQNVEQVCEFLSGTIQKFVEETGLTPEEHTVEAVFGLDYWEEDWPKDRKCSVNFGWSEHSNRVEGEQNDGNGPLDYRAEALLDTVLQKVEEYRACHPEVEQEPAPTRPQSAPPPGIYRQEDGTPFIFGDRVEIVWNEETKHDDVRIWNEETQQWSTYVWNGETRWYEAQLEP